MIGGSLSGSDVFQLLLDKAMRKAGQPGNISRILLCFDEDSDLDSLYQKLLGSSVLLKVNSVRFRTRFLRAPKWAKGNPNLQNAIVLHGRSVDSESEQSLFNCRIEEDSGLVRIDLYQNSEGLPCMLLSMHHVLFDHKGMMLFLKLMNEGMMPEKFIQKLESIPTKQLWKHAFETAKFSFRSSGWGLTTLADGVAKSDAVYKTIRLTQDETAAVEKRAKELGATLSTSVFYIAVLMQAFEQLADKRKAKGNFIWMAAPHDMRKKGEEGHLTGNDISFIYFRRERGSNTELKDVVADLNEQLLHQIKEKLPKKHADFLRLYSHVPLWAYKAMTNMAHGGRVSSFAFSDLGENHSPTQFMGANVRDVIYLPPVPVRPGLSVVVNKSRDELAFTIGTVSDFNLIIPKVISALT